VHCFGQYVNCNHWGVMMKICVQSLDAYNQGQLIFEWLAPLDYSEEDFLKKVEEVTNGADEVMVADYDNAPNCGEYPNLRHYWQLLEQIQREEIDLKLLLAYVDELYINEGITTFENAIQEISDLYFGTFDSMRDFGEYHAELIDLISTVPQQWQHYINIDDYADDLSRDYIFVDMPDGYAVFQRG